RLGCSIEPLGNVNDQREHRRHAFLLDGEAPLLRADAVLHRPKPIFEGGKTMLQAIKAMLEIAHFGNQRQYARADPWAKNYRSVARVTRGSKLIFSSLILNRVPRTPTRYCCAQFTSPPAESTQMFTLRLSHARPVTCPLPSSGATELPRP